MIRGPVEPPISRLPTVAIPLTFRVPIVDVLTISVPIVAVPVDAVMFDPKVIFPSWSGMVAVLIVAVLIVAVLMVAVLMVAVLIADVPTLCVPTLNVPIVAVPVEAVIFEPKVTAPLRMDAPSTEKEPVLLTPVVERDRAEDVLSPSVITCNAPSMPPVVNVLRSCAKLLLMVCVPSVGI